MCPRILLETSQFNTSCCAYSVEQHINFFCRQKQLAGSYTFTNFSWKLRMKNKKFLVSRFSNDGSECCFVNREKMNRRLYGDSNPFEKMIHLKEIYSELQLKLTCPFRLYWKFQFFPRLFWSSLDWRATTDGKIFVCLEFAFKNIYIWCDIKVNWCIAR